MGKANILSCRTFVVFENGLFLADTSKYVPNSSIARPQSDYQDKQDFRGIDLNLDDGSRVWLKVESGHGKLKQSHPAYQANPI